MTKLLPLLLLLSLSAGAQVKDTSVGKITFGQSYSSIGTSEGKTGVSMRLDDSTFSVSGDSLSAIKLLWKRWHDESESRGKEAARMYKHIKSQEKYIKQLKQYISDRDKIDQELRDNLKKAMSKNK